MAAFIGRENELSLLSSVLEKPSAAVIVYGKRKVGKTTLLSQDLKESVDITVYYECLKSTMLEDRKKTTYELNDNLLRFYYAFVYKNKSALTMLGADAFYDEYIEKPLVTFIAHRFEELCRSYFSLQVKKGVMRGVSNIGTYWYDDSESRTNGEFDVVLERGAKYDIYEVKYFASPMTEKDILSESSRIKNIKGLTPGKIGFISAAGFEKDVNGFELISGKQLYDIFIDHYSKA